MAAVVSNDSAFHVRILDGHRVYGDERVFEQVKVFSEGLSPAKKNGKWGYINLMGDFVVHPVYDRAYGFSEGVAAVYKNGGGWGFIDRDGNVIIEPKYETATSFKQGRTIVYDSNARELSVVNYAGNIIDTKKWGRSAD